MIKLIVLGTAQDGGVPHLGCTQPYCERARRDPRFARWVACLALIDREAQKSFLIDATPDVRPQLDYLARHPDAPRRVHRNPVDGVILTHAHIGHYTGLIQFGKEVMATRQLPTYCTERMSHFLNANGPWSQLVRAEHVCIQIITDGQAIQLTSQLSIKPVLIPHRQEWSDTLGLEINGPTKRVLYIPDIDRWGDWECDLCEVVSSCDIALLDGSFYSADELPGRDMSQVPHPLITETMERLQDLTPSGSPSPIRRGGRGERSILFTHLNHTNPAIDPDSPQRREIESRGFHVAADRMEFEL